MPPYFVAIECVLKEAFLRASNLDELGCQFGVNLLETHFIAETVLIGFVHFKVSEALCTKTRPL